MLCYSRFSRSVIQMQYKPVLKLNCLNANISLVRNVENNVTSWFDGVVFIESPGKVVCQLSDLYEA